MDPLLGTHVSVAGGVHNAFARAESVGCRTMQIFVKNANQWFARPLAENDAAAFRDAAARSPVRPVIAHAAYLINLCAVNPEVAKKSRMAFEDELRRCQSLGVEALVFHPGAHMGAGEDAGIAAIIAALDDIHARTPDCTVRTTVETTAGQGTAIGYTLEHLQAILNGVRNPERVAVCMDTCHMFTAGYPINTPEGWQSTMEKFDALIGFQRLAAVHVNDSKKPFGSRLDRHDHIGSGAIGLEGFRPLMNDPRFATIPKILETDKSDDMHEDAENMARLRSLVA